MLDIDKISCAADTIKNLLKYRVNPNEISDVLEINKKRKDIQVKADDLRNCRNILSKEIGIKKSSNSGEGLEELMLKVESFKITLHNLENEQKLFEEQLQNILAKIPNIPMDDVPIGGSDTDNVELYKVGEPRQFDFTPLPHYDILTSLKMWDPERAVKISGRGFPLLLHEGAQLEMALINFMLDHNINHGASQIWLPFVVSSDSLYGTGQLPKFEHDQFKIVDSDLYLNPTAEVALTNMYKNEILESDGLPMNFTAYSPSFRKEAGSYGRDTKGLIRVHQFNKVELVTLCKPEESVKEHEKMLQISQNILDKLELPYRVIVLSQGDMGFSAAKTYDIEVWLPSIGEYKEIASISNCLDFQARRAGIKYRAEGSKKTEFVHTLNGSALAIGRTLVAILENYQQKDGSVLIPKELQSYFKKDKILL